MNSAPIVLLLAAQAEGERQVVERFRLADATRPERAVPLASLELPDQVHVRRLIESGAVRAVLPDLYYLDETAIAARRNPRRLVAGVIVTTLVLVAIAVVLVLLGRHSD